MEKYQIMGLELTVTNKAAKEIEETFKPFDIELKGFNEEFENIISQEINEDLCKTAGELRKKLVKVRTGSEKARKEIKSDVLQLSKAIDSVGKLIKDSVSEKEEKLKEIETHYERIEAEKKEALKTERLAELEKLNIDGSSFGVENMDVIIWESFLAGQKAEYEKRKQEEKEAFLRKLKARQEKEIDKERRIKLAPVWNFIITDLPENLAELENKEFDKILIDALSKKEESDKLQAKIKAENEARETELRKEREEKQRLERELAEKARKEREEAERLEAERIAKEQAPDKEKLRAYFTELLGVKQPAFNNQKFVDLGILFETKLESLISNFKSKL